MNDQTPATKAELSSAEQSIQEKLRQLELSMKDGFVRTEGTFEEKIRNLKNSFEGEWVELKGTFDEKISYLEKSMGSISSHLIRHDKRFDRLHEDNGRTLDVLINVDKRSKQKIDDHEERIMKLETTAA